MNRPAQAAFPMPGVVESVVRTHTNGPLIATAAQLWIGDDELVMDVTYGRGNFWTVYRPARLITHDLRLDGVDFRQLPELDASVDVVVFDPPYIAQGGRETSSTPDFLDRYGLADVPATATGVFELIEAGMKEATRVLRPRGRLLVKCMDYVNGGKLILGRHHVVTTALNLGLVQLDEFIHLGRPGPRPPGRQQCHSRRTHSYLCVFGTDHRYRKRAIGPEVTT